MQVTRMDLDGTGSPMGLVGKILKAEPTISIPVPVEELAIQLDIAEITDVTTQGFEGGLITDDARSSGFILVNNEARLGRRRFTIGHELGHFLMTTHKPGPDGFRCSRDDMRRWSADGKNAKAAIEVQANEFSALLLMPPPIWRRETAKLGDPDLSQIVRLARDFGVSKEAAARTFAQYHDEPIAIVVAKEGRIDRVYRKATDSPLCAHMWERTSPAARFTIAHHVSWIGRQQSKRRALNCGFSRTGVSRFQAYTNRFSFNKTVMP